LRAEIGSLIAVPATDHAAQRHDVLSSFVTLGICRFQVGYLRGTGRVPAIRSFVLDKGQWGIGWDIKFDIGAKALDFRGMYFSVGA